jgi:hypothetical protein
VLVIGDGADSDAEAVVEEIGDSRAEWVALTQRYVYPDRTGTGRPPRP